MNMTPEQILKLAKECGFSFAGRNPVVVMCSVAELENFRKALIEHDAPSETTPIAIHEGCKLLPINPTIEIYEAMSKAVSSGLQCNLKDTQIGLQVYRAALSVAPSAPIEAEQSGKDEALNMAIEAINMHRARYDNLVNAITNAIEIGNKPLIPSTQAPKES